MRFPAWNNSTPDYAGCYARQTTTSMQHNGYVNGSKLRVYFLHSIIMVMFTASYIDSSLDMDSLERRQSAMIFGKLFKGYRLKGDA